MNIVCIRPSFRKRIAVIHSNGTQWFMTQVPWRDPRSDPLPSLIGRGRREDQVILAQPLEDLGLAGADEADLDRLTSGTRSRLHFQHPRLGAIHAAYVRRRRDERVGRRATSISTETVMSWRR